MPRFCLSTLGCRVNHYESEQIATLLCARGWTRTEQMAEADLRIINTCSVTVQAASKSRQTVRQVVRLPVLTLAQASSAESPSMAADARAGQRTIVTGCWATSHPQDAAALPGVTAVLTHHDDLATELDRLLSTWSSAASPTVAPVKGIASDNKTQSPPRVKKKSLNQHTLLSFAQTPALVGTPTLPLLDHHQDSHQRGFLKVQDGCDAHCTYCIIPQLRPRLWSKPIHDAIDEARRLVAAGHLELVLTGIFLGAYGQPTALRRRQPQTEAPLARLVEALCTQVAGLQRLRLSSLEPGDLSDHLLRTLKSHPQVVPHFHLPLQSGSDAILHRMNRQYRRDDFLRMIDQVHAAFDRPAITTDIIVAFPGETEADFQQTLDVVDRARFIHIHAFPFSPRPGTAAARWRDAFLHGPIANDRIDILRQRALSHSLVLRQSFLGQRVQVMVEREPSTPSELRHGRCERYFSVHFDSSEDLTGRSVPVRIDRVTPTRTFGTRLAGAGGSA